MIRNSYFARTNQKGRAVRGKIIGMLLENVRSLVKNLSQARSVSPQAPIKFLFGIMHFMMCMYFVISCSPPLPAPQLVGISVVFFTRSGLRFLIWQC